MQGEGGETLQGGRGFHGVSILPSPFPFPNADVIRKEVESRVMTYMMHLCIVSFSRQKIQIYYQSCPHSRAEADLLPTPSLVTG